ncbi:hypothetical protein O1611_g8039 [Lasiodiplodia mahajangana]|uniref:Uncharacterized protein n=1 Tax=Lasiodiplodia mahajangana TaxID=1108764 RepID=A0ACC2JDP7_9PEZI|nr:hypothetical protein O1611_g8039 [Lasiodiplodia mahajangana]
MFIDYCDLGFMPSSPPCSTPPRTSPAKPPDPQGQLIFESAVASSHTLHGARDYPFHKSLQNPGLVIAISGVDSNCSCCVESLPRRHSSLTKKNPSKAQDNQTSRKRPNEREGPLTKIVRHADGQMGAKMGPLEEIHSVVERSSLLYRLELDTQKTPDLKCPTFNFYLYVVSNLADCPLTNCLYSQNHKHNEMDVSLQYVEDNDLIPEDQAMFKILKATLEYTAATEIKSAKLAQDINFIVAAENRDGGTPGVLDYIWDLILNISQCIPPDHPWQDCLLQAIGHLRQQDGTVPAMGVCLWKELPDLPMTIREHWIDPVGNKEDECNVGEFARWQNQNSFVARLTSASLTTGQRFPIWQLRAALEEPPTRGRAQECRLWVACEWIIRCDGFIYQCMNSGWSDEQSFQTGSLCDGFPHFSINRWNFWKKRFAEMSADAENLGLENAIVARISDAIRTMEAIPE